MGSPLNSKSTTPHMQLPAGILAGFMKGFTAFEIEGRGDLFKRSEVETSSKGRRDTAAQTSRICDRKSIPQNLLGGKVWRRGHVSRERRNETSETFLDPFPAYRHFREVRDPATNSKFTILGPLARNVL